MREGTSTNNDTTIEWWITKSTRVEIHGIQQILPLEGEHDHLNRRKSRS